MKPRALSVARLTYPLAAALAALISLPHASAQTWTGGGANANWNTAANWTGGTPSTSTSATTTVTFYNTGAAQLTNSTGTRYNLTQIAANATATSPVTINVTAGNTGFTSGANIRFNAGTNLNIAAGNHRIVGTGVTNGTTYDVVFNGAASSTHTMTIATGASFEIQGRIMHATSDNKSYIKNGGGTLIFSGQNGGSSSWTIDSTKAFTVQEGVLRFASAAAGGFSGNNYTVTSGAALELSGGVVQTVNNGIYTLNGSGISNTGALRNLNGNNTISASSTATGNVVLSTATTIGVETGTTLTIRKLISGTGALTKVGAGELILGATFSDSVTLNHTFSGNTLVSAGKITLGNGLALQNSAYDTTSVNGGLDLGTATTPTFGGLTGSGNLSSTLITGYGNVTSLTLNPGTGITQTYTGVIANGAAGMALIKNGAGAQILSGNNTYTGSTIINAGVVVLNNESVLGGNNPGVNGTSAISLASGATIRSNFIGAGSGYVNSFTYAPITLSGTGDANLQIGAGTSTAPSPAVVFNINGAIGGSINNLVYSAVNTLNNSDSTFVLGAAGTYTGNTLITTNNTANRINVRAGVPNAMPITTVLTIDGGAGSGSGRFAQFDLNGNNQELAGLTNVTGRSLRNQRVTNNSTTAATLTINNASDFTFGGLVTGSTNTSAQITGNLALTKNGVGRFTLAAGSGNSYTGNTTILAGILSLGHPTSIQSSTLNTAGSVVGDATNGLQTTVTTLTLGGISGDKNLADVFTTSSGGYSNITSLTLNPGTGFSPSYSGNIANGSPDMTLTKTGVGTQTLSGLLTFSGFTSVNAGILSLDYSVQDNSKLADGAALILSGGTLNLVGGTHAENVLSTTLTAGTSSRITSSGAAPIQLNSITIGENASVDFGASGIATTDNLNNAYGILGAWATVNGSLAVNSTNAADGLITGVVSTDVARLNDGLQVIPDGSSNNIRIIEGTGLSANITLGAATTTVNTLFQTTVGGTSAATIDAGGQILRSNAMIVGTGAGNLTIINGTLTAAIAGGSLDLANSSSAGSLGIDTVIDNNTTASQLNKTGPGLVTLTNANTYSGVTTINGGTLRISHPNALGSTSAGLVVNGSGTGGTANARLELSGGITVSGENATLSGSGNFLGAISSFNGINEWAGDITLASSTAQTRLGASSGATLKVSGVIKDDGVNTLGLAIRSESNTGIVSLSGTNTYLGDTSLLIGKLILEGGNNRLPIGTRFTMGNSTNVVEFDLNGRNQELAGIAVFSGATTANNSINNSDTVNLSTLTINTTDTSPSTFGGLLTGNLALVKTGTDALTLTGNNNFIGGTTVTAGTLTATKNAATTNALSTGAVSIASGATVVVNVTKTTSITDSLDNTFTGAGLLKLQFAANTTARNIAVTGVNGFNGTIQLSNLGSTGDKWTATDVGTVNGSLIIDSGSTLFLSSGTTGANFAGGITVNGAGNAEGRGAIRLVSTTLGGNISLASSSTISMENVNALITGNISTSTAGAHVLTLGGTTGAVGGTLSGNISDGTGTLTITSANGANILSGTLSHSGGVNVTAGVFTLSGSSNTYTGLTTITANNGRSLLVAANQALGATGAGNETVVGSSGQLGFSGGINYTANEKIIGSGIGNSGGQGVFASGSRGFVQSVSGNNTFAGSIELSADGLSRIGTQDGAQLTLSGPITQGTGITTANILFRVGSINGDFVTLANNGNSFGGDSTVFSTLATAGQYCGLRLGVDNAHPTNLTVTSFSSSSGSSTSLDLNGKQQTLNGLSNGGPGTLNIINLDTVNASTLTLNPSQNLTNGTNMTILGGSPGDTPLGVINVVKTGTFTQTLVSTHSYTGTTTISEGTLQIGNGTDTGSIASSSAIINNAALVYNVGAGNRTYANVISGTGTLTQASAGGTLTLAGLNTYSGNTTVSAGTLVLADDAKLRFVLGASSGSNNSIGGSGTLTLNGDIEIDTSAADSLASGTWTLVDHAGLTETYASTFTVIGFTDVGSNKWEKTVGTKKYTFDEATGILTLSASASYASWINDFFPGETDTNIIGSAADPDKDGVANAVEMVVGGNPATGMDTALLPTIELVTDPVSTPAIPAGNYILFTFRRTDLSVTAGVTSVCETDTDLAGTWTPATSVPGAVIQVDDNFTFVPAAPDTDRVRVYIPRGANTANFGRLQVQVPEPDM